MNFTFHFVPVPQLDIIFFEYVNSPRISGLFGGKKSPLFHFCMMETSWGMREEADGGGDAPGGIWGGGA